MMPETLKPWNPETSRSCKDLKESLESKTRGESEALKRRMTMWSPQIGICSRRWQGGTKGGKRRCNAAIRFSLEQSLTFFYIPCWNFETLRPRMSLWAVSKTYLTGSSGSEIFEASRVSSCSVSLWSLWADKMDTTKDIFVMCTWLNITGSQAACLGNWGWPDIWDGKTMEHLEIDLRISRFQQGFRFCPETMGKAESL